MVQSGQGARVRVQESEEELNARLRELKGMDKERQKHRKLTKAEQEEENLFKKNKGVGPLRCAASSGTRDVDPSWGRPYGSLHGRVRLCDCLHA